MQLRREEVSIIKSHKYSFSRALNAKANIYFALALFRIFKKDGIIPASARFGDYFEAIPIDMAGTKTQRDNLEAFYTIYGNRLNGRYSFGLSHNFLFNFIVGGTDSGIRRSRTTIVDVIEKVPTELDERKAFLFITKEHLDSAVELGLNKMDLVWYFKISISAVEILFDHYYPDKDFRSIQREVIRARLIKLAKLGVPLDTLDNYFLRGRENRDFIMKHYKEESFKLELVPYSKRAIMCLVTRCLGGRNDYHDILFKEYLRPQILDMYKSGLITKESLLDVINGFSTLSHLDPIAPFSSAHYIAFRWIFEMVLGPDIESMLSKKDYGGGGEVPVDLLKDLGLYTEDSGPFNSLMKKRVKTILKSMFGTTDLSEIYRLLNTRTL